MRSAYGLDHDVCLDRPPHPAKIAGLVAGMAAGGDCISGIGLLRRGGMGRLFVQARSPSTFGTFLRALNFGHVRRPDAVAAQQLVELPVRDSAGQPQCRWPIPRRRLRRRAVVARAK